jgi:hypothetical protein
MVTSYKNDKIELHGVACSCKLNGYILHNFF